MTYSIKYIIGEETVYKQVDLADLHYLLKHIKSKIQTKPSENMPLVMHNKIAKHNAKIESKQVNP